MGAMEYVPFSVQHPSKVTTFGCEPRCCIIINSLIRSSFSRVDEISFTILTATKRVKPSCPLMSSASAFHTCEDNFPSLLHVARQSVHGNANPSPANFLYPRAFSRSVYFVYTQRRALQQFVLRYVHTIIRRLYVLGRSFPAPVWFVIAICFVGTPTGC